MTPKENLLRVIRHDGPQWVPNGMESVWQLGPPVVERPGKAGLDSWGVRWELRSDAHGGTFPAHGGHAIADVTEWRERITVPDVDAMDFSRVAAEAAGIDRDAHLVSGFVEFGLFERAYCLLGMEQALMAYLAEPDLMEELVGTIADYKIRLIERFDDAADLDLVWYGDDWGNQRQLFLPPDTWRRIIRPHTKRVFDAAVARGILVNLHSCGRIEEIFGDIVEMGASVWNPCQPCNDLAALKRTYAGRIAFCGGIDSQFILDRPGVTPEDVRAEVRRRIDDLAADGGYIAGPSHAVPYDRDLLDAMNDEIATYGRAFYRTAGCESSRDRGHGMTETSWGFARAPEGALEIERGPAPLFRDPIFDGAADPSVVYEPSDGRWLIYYTQRRANVPTPGVAWCFGCKVGIACSTDKGRTWSYVGTAKGLDRGSDLDTFWAPHVFRHDGESHMFVTYIDKIPHAWGQGSPLLLHYTSDDGLHWRFSDVVDTGSDNIIDAGIVRLPDRRWLLVFRDDNAGTRTGLCVSTDLRTWERLPHTVGDRRHEGPVVICWKDKYWMMVDDWQGLGVYVSDDGLHYDRNGTILDLPGRRPDDGAKAGHPGAAIVGDRASVFYFVHPDRRPDVPEWETANTHTYQYKRSSLQVAELEVVDGKLTCDRDKHAR